MAGEDSGEAAHQHRDPVNLSDFAQRCSWPPREPVVRARLEVLGLLVTCKRCSGTGRYEMNPLDQTCYGCAGSGKKLPPLTARLAASVRARQDAGERYAVGRARRTTSEVSPETIAEYVSKMIHQE